MRQGEVAVFAHAFGTEENIVQKVRIACILLDKVN